MGLFLSGMTPIRLNCFPPRDHFLTKTGNGEIVASQGFMGVAEVITNLGQSTVECQLCAL